MHQSHVQCKWYGFECSNQYQCKWWIEKWKPISNFVALCLALMDSILTFSKSAIKIKCIEIEEKAEKKHCKD